MNATKLVLLFICCFSSTVFGWNPPTDYVIRPNEKWGEIFTWPQNEVIFRDGSYDYKVYFNEITLESADPSYPGYFLDFQGGAAPGNTNAIINKGKTPGSKWRLRTYLDGPNKGLSTLESADPSYLGYFLDFQGGAAPGNTNAIIHKNRTAGSYWNIHYENKTTILLESADPSYPGYFLDFQGGAAPGNTNAIINKGKTPGSKWIIQH